MKKLVLAFTTLCIASTALWAEFTVDTQLRMSSYMALDEDRDFSYKFDDNNGGNYGFKVTGYVGDHTTLNMNLMAAGAYNAEGGNTDIYLGSIYFESELWRNVLAGEDEFLNDLLSVKLQGGIKSYGPPNSFGFAENINYGGAGLSRASLSTEKGLGLGSKASLNLQELGFVNFSGGFLVDAGVDGFQTALGGRSTEDGEEHIGTQAPQYYVSLGYDLLGTRGSYGYKDFQVFADVALTNNGGVNITPSDYLTSAADGSVRNGGTSVGAGVRVNIPVDLVQDDPYTHLTVAGSFGYFFGEKFTEADLIISDASTVAMTFNPYFTYGADLGWFMPFSENMVMDIGYGVRGQSAMTYTDASEEEEVLLQQNENLDMATSIMFKFPNVMDGAQIGAVASLDNMLNFQSLPNIDDDKIRGFLNQDPNLTVALAGGVMQKVGKAMFTHQLQAGFTNLLGNDLYVSTSDDAAFVDPEFIGGIGTEMKVDDLKIDLGFVLTPFGGLETMLVGAKTGRDDLDAGQKTGLYLNVTMKL